MENPIISIIVPIYNVEKYLEKCVNSILNQTYKNLDIILVNDGSPDNCGKLCDAFAQKDPRVRVIHKENGGLSSARNAGLDIAMGELIGFVDSDDYIEPDMYEFLLRNLLQTDADISVCGVYDYRSKKKAHMFSTDLYVLTAPEAMTSLLERGNCIRMCVWNKLYRRHLFSKLRFPVGRIYEDTFVMAPLLDLSEKTVIQPIPKYHYIRRPGSITTSPYRPECLDRMIAANSLSAYITEKHPHLLNIVKIWALSAYFTTLDEMIMANSNVDEKKKLEIVYCLRQHVWKILKFPAFTIQRKIAMICLCIHENLYKVLVVIHHTLHR